MFIGNKKLILIAGIFMLLISSGCSFEKAQNESVSKNMTGKWVLIEISAPGMEAKGEQLKQLTAGKEYSVDLKADGSAVFHSPIAGDGLRKMTWKIEKGKLTLKDVDDTGSEKEIFEIKEDKITGRFEDAKLVYQKTR